MIQAETVFEKAKEQFGAVPPVVKIINGRSTLAAALLLEGITVVEAGGAFSLQERELLITAISGYNGCELCAQIHADLAKKAGVGTEDIQNVTAGAIPGTPRLAQLVKLTWLLMEKKGKLSGEEEKKLIAEPAITQEELHEMITLISIMTITNYSNNLVKALQKAEAGI